MHDDFAWAGRISFVVKHRHCDWMTNPETYRFPEVRHDPIAINAAKHPDGTLRVRVAGPFGREFEFIQAMRPCDTPSIRVGLVWAAQEIALYLDGEYCQAKRARVSVH
jgi:hypothetical protein